MRLPRSRYLALFLAGCVLAALGWGMQAYVDLVRLEASLIDTRARVETASRVRLELVETLVRDAQAGRRAEALAQVDLAASRVRELGLLPAGLENDGGPTEFRDAQGALTAALDAMWDGRTGSHDPSLERTISDLQPEIQYWSATLDRGLEEFERQLESFRASAAGFPGSLIAGIPRREGPADSSVETATSRAEIAAAVSGFVR